MDSNALFGILRAVLTSAGGALVANGTFTSAQWQQIVGVAIILAGAAWSWIQKRQAHAALVTSVATSTVTPATLTSPVISPHA